MGPRPARPEAQDEALILGTPRPSSSRSQGPSKRRHGRVGAANAVGLIALTGLIALVACQPGADASPTPAGPVGSGLIGTPGVAPAPASPSASSPAAPSAATALAAALDRLDAGYTFASQITVGGAVATQAQGRSFNGASDFTVESNGASIAYRTVPPTSWVKQAGQDWVAVDNGVPDGDPLEALRAPTSIVRDGGGPDGDRLRAIYRPADLGLTGDAPVRVDLSIAPDGSVRATYGVPTAAGVAISRTTLSPLTDQQPIVAPSPIATV